MAAGLADTPTSVACPAAGLEDAAAAAAASADPDMFQAVDQQVRMPERDVKAVSEKAAAKAELQTRFSQQLTTFGTLGHKSTSPRDQNVNGPTRP